MKKTATLFVLFVLINSFDQRENAYTTGEWLKMRIHYGVVNAGYATLEVKEATKNNKKVHHVIGKGWTIGMTKFFFNVDDNYESYFDKETGKPYQFVRKIDEGGYTKNQVGFFNQAKNTVLVKDYKHDKEKTLSVPEEVQDIVSSYYYLRNHPKINKLKVGESIAIDMFFDGETTKFKLKFLGKEDISTKFGKVSCLIFRPYVQAGRVFQEEESLTVLVSDDDNKIPIRVKASLAVGSLKADIESFKGLKYSFKIKSK
jgi:LysM repeat protein